MIVKRTCTRGSQRNECIKRQKVSGMDSVLIVSRRNDKEVLVCRGKTESEREK
jgi:hypothetical protein